MKIFWQARRSYPAECCGVLLAELGGIVVEAVSCENVAETPCNRYQIAPAELIRVQREARSRGLKIAGFYHSHPEHSGEASAMDSAEAYWTGCSYVIAGVMSWEVREVRSYRLGVEGVLSEEPVLVVAPTARV